MPKDKSILTNLTGGVEGGDIMCQFNPEHKQHMRYKSGFFLYLIFIRAIYGYIESELLWYTIFSTTLEGIDFEINPYDRCVANKIIEGA